MPPMINLIGNRFNKLTVINLYGEDTHHRKIWLCRCDCGNEKPIRSRHLISGRVKTCGCKIGLILSKPFLGRLRENHSRWKGGKFISSDGYIMIYIVNGQYDLEHKLLYEKTYGNIPKGYVVHHINEIKTDNRLDNLELLSRSDHAKLHELGVHVRGNRWKARTRK